MKHKKPKAVFVPLNGGGSYKMNIYLVENATDKQNQWANAQGSVIYDFQLGGVKADLKKDGFIVKVD